MSKSKIGQRFTRLLVVDVADPYISPKGVKSNRWKCLCDCGNFIDLRSCALTTQNNRSCGCLLDESRKRGNPIHGCKGHPLWEIYYAMVRRCSNEKDSNFPQYGGRGISVCDEWIQPAPVGFEKFIEDMGERPDNSNLDRIDPDKGYSKDNCRWVDKALSSFNTRKKVSNTSGRTGVNWIKRLSKWRAVISLEGKSVHLGVFVNFEDAVKAREEAELLYFGELKAEAR